jgi:hypothetical protein
MSVKSAVGRLQGVKGKPIAQRSEGRNVSIVVESGETKSEGEEEKKRNSEGGGGKG